MSIQTGEVSEVRETPAVVGCNGLHVRQREKDTVQKQYCTTYSGHEEIWGPWKSWWLKMYLPVLNHPVLEGSQKSANWRLVLEIRKILMFPCTLLYEIKKKLALSCPHPKEVEYEEQRCLELLLLESLKLKKERKKY
mgnify:CR=1 FL=1